MLGSISGAARYLWLGFYSIDFEAAIFVFHNQENLIQCTEPDSVQVSTKDMDSTLSKASRAIKKTSKKVKVAAPRGSGGRRRKETVLESAESIETGVCVCVIFLKWPPPESALLICSRCC